MFVCLRALEARVQEFAVCSPEAQRLGVQVVRGAVGDAHVQRHALAVKRLSHSSLHCFHQLGGDAHLAVAAQHS